MYKATDTDVNTEGLLLFIKDRIGIKAELYLGVIKDRDDENIDTISELWEVPVVILEKRQKGAVYLLSQAVRQAIEARISKSRWLIILPPVTEITEYIQKEYEEYMASLELLRAA